jgi:hypothetical protein
MCSSTSAIRGARSRALAALLRPGGTAVVSVPNIAHWTARPALLRDRFEYAAHDLLDETHLRLSTRASALELATRAGLRVRDQRFAPAPLPLQSRIAALRSPRGRRRPAPAGAVRASVRARVRAGAGAQRPFHTGSRFSLNATAPSRASSESKMGSAIFACSCQNSSSLQSPCR